MSQRLMSLFLAAQLPQGELRTFLEQVANDAISPSLLDFPETVTWVATNGSDATGQRGNIGAPFATVGAALLASLSGDTILIAPGTYPAVEDPDFPAGLLAVTLEGVGARESCVITSATGPALRWTPGVNAKRITLRSLTISTTDPVSSAVVVAGPGPGTPNNSTLTLQNCALSAPLSNALSASSLLAVNLTDCSGSVSISDCNGGLCQGHQAGDVGIFVDNPVPAHVTRSAYLVKGSTVGILNVSGQGWIDADAVTTAFALSGGTLLTPLGDTASITFQGFAGFASIFPSGTGSVFINLQNAQIPVVQCSSQVTAGNTQRINAKNAIIGRGIMQSPGGGDLILDTQGGTLGRTDTAFGANCFWDRDGGGDAAINIANGPNVLTFGTSFNDPPYPPGVPVAFSVASGTLGTLATDQLAITAASNAGCTINSGFVAPITGRVLWQREWS
jgi:hypothetical protein